MLRHLLDPPIPVVLKRFVPDRPRREERIGRRDIKATTRRGKEAQTVVRRLDMRCAVYPLLHPVLLRPVGGSKARFGTIIILIAKLEQM